MKERRRKPVYPAMKPRIVQYFRQLANNQITTVATVFTALLHSSRGYVLAGFAVTLLSVAGNSIVLFHLTDRISNVDEEYRDLRDALFRQNSDMDEASAKMQRYLLLHNMVPSLPPANQPEAKAAAKDMLADALISYHTAAADVSPIEVGRVVVNMYAQAIGQIEAMMGAAAAAATSPAAPATTNSAQMMAALEAAAKATTAATSAGALVPSDPELGKKIEELGKIAEIELTATSPVEFVLRLMPFVKAKMTDWTVSVAKKEKQMRALETERDRLQRWLVYSNYASLSLQIVGLMIVLMQDLGTGRGEETTGATTPVAPKPQAVA